MSMPYYPFHPSKLHTIQQGTALLTALLTGTMFLRIGQPSCKMDGASLALAVCLGTLGLLSGGRISLAGYVAIGVLNACGRVRDM